MKKSILGSIALAATLVMSVNAFAEPAAGKMISNDSIPASLQARAAALNQPSNALSKGVAAAVTAAFHDTYIVVINYTKESIRVVWPTATVTVTERTASRYVLPDYTGNTYLRLENMNGVPFWNDYVQYHDLVEVYLVDGKYQVRFTH